MNEKNFYLYQHCITKYEEAGNLTLENGVVKLNGKVIDSYTFKLGYYFMMGDNRHNSEDSRMWGFVPETHIVGKALFIWFSWEKFETGFFNKIRWSRMFNGID
ncbi:MAG: signal peptidase I, partial [Bacteroidetes bacterium]|nr:signal peptidase I [Bacteroidota bacterium]